MSARPKAETIPVVVGQVWESCDARDGGRRVRVERVEATYAFLRNLKTNRVTRVFVAAMRPVNCGWRCVHGRPVEPPEAA